MTLSAAQALFYNQSALILSGLPNTTQYMTYPPMPKAGEVSQVNLRTLALMLSILHLLCFCPWGLGSMLAIHWGLQCAVHAMLAHQARQD